MNSLIYSIYDFKIKIKDNNHVWELIKPKQYNYLDIIIYDEDFNDILPGCHEKTICYCKICKAYSLRIKKDDYFPFNFEYYTPKQILTCDEVIIKDIIE